jgi:hypothetical protein
VSDDRGDREVDSLAPEALHDVTLAWSSMTTALARWRARWGSRSGNWRCSTDKA